MKKEKTIVRIYSILILYEIISFIILSICMIFSLKMFSLITLLTLYNSGILIHGIILNWNYIIYIFIKRKNRNIFESILFNVCSSIEEEIIIAKSDALENFYKVLLK
jgi:hypothetical protein